MKLLECQICKREDIKIINLTFPNQFIDVNHISSQTYFDEFYIEYKCFHCGTKGRLEIDERFIQKIVRDEDNNVRCYLNEEAISQIRILKDLEEFGGLDN